MSDEKLREIERRYKQSGSEEDAEALLRERLRNADLTIMILKTLVRLHRAAISTSNTEHWLETYYSRRVTFKDLLRFLDQQEKLETEPEKKDPVPGAVRRAAATHPVDAEMDISMAEIRRLAGLDAGDTLASDLAALGFPSSRRTMMEAAQQVLALTQQRLGGTGMIRSTDLSCGCASEEEHNQKLSDHDL